MKLDIEAAASNYKLEGAREDLPREFRMFWRTSLLRRLPHLSVPLLELV